MKKVFAVILVTLLLAALWGCGKEAPNAETMADFASVGAAYTQAVRHVVADRLMKADEANCFRPQEVMPRAEAENLVYTIAGMKETSSSTDAGISGLAFAQMLMQVTGNEGNNTVGNFISYNANLTDNALTREQAAQLAHNYTTYQKAVKASMEQTTISFAGGANLKLLGRAEAVENGVLTNFPGDGVEFSLECAGPMTVQFHVGGTGQYRAEVDGELVDYKLDAAESVVLAPMLSAGKHNIRILQENDISTPGQVNTIAGITLLCKADTLAPAPEKDLYIEFVGDSITAGMGTIGDTSTPWTRETHSGTHSYSYMTAKKLNTDYAIIAKGGIGAYMVSHPASQGEYVANELYAAHNVYRDPNRPATHGKADIVVIAIGTNDREEDPDTRFETKYKELVLQIREANPTADLVLIYNMMNARHAFYFKELAEELGGEEKGYYTLMMQRLVNGVRSGDVTNTPHPSAEDNDKNSDKLVEFLKTLPSMQNRK